MEQYTWMILYSFVVSLYSIMDVIKDVEEVGLNHGAIIHGWYYIVYVVSLYSIMDVIKDVEEVGLNHGAMYTWMILYSLCMLVYIQ